MEDHRRGRTGFPPWHAGFYRVLELGAERLRVRYLATLHERFAVYRDEASVLRCDHEVRFLGISMSSPCGG